MDTPTNNNTPANNPANLAEKNNMVMAILAYIGPLVIVSFLVAKNDPFVKFHIKQGLVLLVIEVAVWILGMIFYMFWPILNLVNFATFIFAIVGIIRVTQGKEMQLPLVGKYSSYFKI